MLIIPKFKILYSIFVILVFALLSTIVFAQVSSPTIRMTISSNQVSVGSEIEFKMFVTANDPINAFDITLVHTGSLLEFVRSRTDKSIATVWQSFPLVDDNGKIRLVGGMTSPFTGKDGEIITLVFKAIEKGGAELTVERADIALADGKGTLLSGGMGNLKIKILEGDNNPVLIQNNAPAPKISDVIVSKDPETSNSLIMVRTDNDGGVKQMEIRTRDWFTWGDWQKSDLTASVPKNAWALEIKALGFDNTESSRIIYFWSALFTKFGMIIVGIIILLLIKRKFRRIYGE
ncbi:MAG: cohesin domain-containing protein [bacterium]|nr:cohesin domain-containing protein [bacterium]